MHICTTLKDECCKWSTVHSFEFSPPPPPLFSKSRFYFLHATLSPQLYNFMTLQNFTFFFFTSMKDVYSILHKNWTNLHWKASCTLGSKLSDTRVLLSVPEVPLHLVLLNSSSAFVDSDFGSRSLSHSCWTRMEQSTLPNYWLSSDVHQPVSKCRIGRIVEIARLHGSHQEVGQRQTAGPQGAAH